MRLPSSLLAWAALAAPVAAQCGPVHLVPPAPQANINVGLAVALHGDTALLGVPQYDASVALSGGVYVLERGPGGWAFDGMLDLSADELFLSRWGSAVALTDQRAFVASLELERVLVLRRESGAWVREGVIVAPQANAEFGFDLDAEGLRLVVGAPRTVVGSLRPGAAHVFEYDGDTWVETRRISPAAAPNSGRLGASVDLDGDRIALSGDRTSGNGEAYVYEHDGSDWIQDGVLLPVDPTDVGNFGHAVALDGDRAVVGAPESGVDGLVHAGLVFVYERSGGAWSEVGRVASPTPSGDGYLGDSLALAGDTLFAGGRYDSSGSFLGGSVTVLQRVAGSWAGVDRFLANPTYGETRLFGAEIALSGDQLLIGIPVDATAGLPSVGSVELRSVAPFALAHATCGAALAPCGNADPYAGCANSTGSGARARACGSASVSADDLVLTADSLPPGQAGLFAMAPATAAPFPFGDGLLGLTGGFFRFPVRTADGSGRVSEGPGLAAFAGQAFGASGQIVAGSSWAFQFWYRDPAGPCGGGFNLTNGLRATFQP